MADLNAIDPPQFKILTESRVCFHHIDLYVYTGSSRLPVTHTGMLSWLARHEGLMNLIEEGVLVVHPEESAPTLSRSIIP